MLLDPYALGIDRHQVVGACSARETAAADSVLHVLHAGVLLRTLRQVDHTRSVQGDHRLFRVVASPFCRFGRRKASQILGPGAARSRRPIGAQTAWAALGVCWPGPLLGALAGAALWHPQRLAGALFGASAGFVLWLYASYLLR